MITFKKFLQEGVDNASLHVFDIDDTLFRTSARVMLKRDGKIIRSISSSEFNTYKLKDGEEYDFSEFKDAKKFRHESEPIDKVIDNLKRIHTGIKNRLSPGSKIIINTARSDFDNKEYFLDTFRHHGIDIDDIHVHRAGNIPGDHPPAAKKLVFIRGYLNKKKYKNVFMYDDAKQNLQYFLSLKNEYPDTNFFAFLVTHRGSLVPFK